MKGAFGVSIPAESGVIHIEMPEGFREERVSISAESGVIHITATTTLIGWKVSIPAESGVIHIEFAKETIYARVVLSPFPLNEGSFTSDDWTAGGVSGSSFPLVQGSFTSFAPNSAGCRVSLHSR